jgi:SAM-dependent methyltransferase
VRGWIVSDRVIEALKRRPRAYRASRRVRMHLGAVVPPREVDGIRGRVHRNDTMLRDASPEGVQRYAQGARNVLDLIEEGLRRTGRDFDDAERWLDFGCGYGRIVRELVQRVDRRRIHAADANAEGVRFCASEFGVHPIYVPQDPAGLSLPSFDVIYAISVLTHLPPERGRELLRVLGEALAEDGLLLFTTHGQRSVETAGVYGAAYEPLQESLQREVESTGVAYVPYGHYAGDDYGMTWHSRDYVVRTMTELDPSLELVYFEPHGLDEHQDVFAYRRPSSA